jgi:ABC-type sugar transport system ATPase subunit
MSQIQQLRIVPNDPKCKVMNLSGGNQQKVVLAKSLDTQSSVLILDEPTAGVDVGAKSEIRSLINQLADNGNAILLISSEIPEVLALADRVIVMKEGQIVGELGSAEATSERIIHLAMTGER